MLSRRGLLKSGSSVLALQALWSFAASPLSAASAKAAGAAGTEEPSDTGALTTAQLLRRARSWTYQLQNYDISQLRASNADLLVVDETIGSEAAGKRPGKFVKELQKKPDGSRRIVLAYLSIGEAEDYRYYWDSAWIETADSAASSNEPTTSGLNEPSRSKSHDRSQRPERRLSSKAPPWLGDENEAWSGNYTVRFENPDWQAIFLEGKNSYISRIINAGFDGVYLDRVDAFYDHPGNLQDPASTMVAFVSRLAEKARRLKPGFLVVPQNGEELLVQPGYVDIIDAIAKEDLLYGSPDEGEANSNGQIANSVAWLAVAQRKEKPVFVVEYLDDSDEIAHARQELNRLGYIPTFAPRMLDEISAHALPQTDSHSTSHR